MIRVIGYVAGIILLHKTEGAVVDRKSCYGHIIRVHYTVGKTVGLPERN